MLTTSATRRILELDLGPSLDSPSIAPPRTATRPAALLLEDAWYRAKIERAKPWLLAAWLCSIGLWALLIIVILQLI